MKKTLLFLLSFLIFALFSSCKKEDSAPTELNIQVTHEPAAGALVNSIYADFNGEITGPIKPINVTAQWWWEEFPGRNTQLLGSQTYTFNSGVNTSHSFEFSAPNGYVLWHYFWLRLSWTDDKGLHTINTSKVYLSLATAGFNNTH
jgi:hypothetical protein